MEGDSRIDPLGEGRAWWRQLRAAATAGEALAPEWTALMAADRDTVRRQPSAADAWWRLGLSLHALGQMPAAGAAFLEALKHDPSPAQVLVANCERRFLGHEAPVFDALLAQGLRAHLVCAETESFERALHDDRVRESGGRVSFVPRDALYAWLASPALPRVSALVTATPRPLLEMPGSVRTVLVSHDLVGFQRGDLKDWARHDEDGRQSLARFCAFDLYLTGSQLAQDDLLHRLRFYRPQIDPALQRRSDEAPAYCAPVGYAKLDRNLARLPRPQAPPRALLLAPTEHGCNPGTWSFEELVQIVDALARAFPAHPLILRPHPYDLDRHPLVYERIERAFGEALGRRFHLDRGLDAIELWAEAALLVTDSSGTAWNFAFTTLRPVVFHSPRESQMDTLYGGSSAWATRTRIGTTSCDREGLIGAVQRCLEEGDASRIATARDEIAFHLGHAAERSARAVQALLHGEVLDDWTRV